MVKQQGSLGFTLRKEGENIRISSTPFHFHLVHFWIASIDHFQCVGWFIVDDSVLGHYVRALVRDPAVSEGREGRIKPGDKIVAVSVSFSQPSVGFVCSNLGLLIERKTFLVWEKNSNKTGERRAPMSDDSWRGCAIFKTSKRSCETSFVSWHFTNTNCINFTIIIGAIHSKHWQTKSIFTVWHNYNRHATCSIFCLFFLFISFWYASDLTQYHSTNVLLIISHCTLSFSPPSLIYLLLLFLYLFQK